MGTQAIPDAPTATQSGTRVTNQTSPSRDAKLYAENYLRYRALYPALKSVFNNGMMADQKAED